MIVVLLACAALVVPRPRPRIARPEQDPSSRSRSRRVSFNRIAAGAIGVAAIILVPLPWGAGVAVVGAFAAHRLLPSEFSHGADQRRLSVARQLPDCVDLLAALLRAGLTDAQALSLVVGATEGPLNDDLRRVASHRRLGASPRQAWRTVNQEAQLTDLAVAMTRHADTGSSIAGVLDRVAADARRDYFAHAQAAARSAAVRAVIPLAACFLPSFILLGVVPIVASLFFDLTF